MKKTLFLMCMLATIFVGMQNISAQKLNHTIFFDGMAENGYENQDCGIIHIEDDSLIIIDIVEYQFVYKESYKIYDLGTLSLTEPDDVVYFILKDDNEQSYYFYLYLNKTFIYLINDNTQEDKHFFNYKIVR